MKNILIFALCTFFLSIHPMEMHQQTDSINKKPGHSRQTSDQLFPSPTPYNSPQPPRLNVSPLTSEDSQTNVSCWRAITVALSSCFYCLCGQNYRAPWTWQQPPVPKYEKED